MMEPYELELLPLGVPDDDPRQTAYLDLFAIVPPEGRTSDNGLAVFHRYRCAGGTTLGMVTTEGSGLEECQVVAGLA